MGQSMIRFRLRKGKDDDLQAEFDKIPPTEEKSDVIRAALRLFFFGGYSKYGEAPKNTATGNVESLAPIVEGLRLEKVEKDDADVSADLDNLLGSF